MSKKDDGEQPTRLAGKIADGKKKSSQRRQRLEKRSRRRTRKSRRSNIIDHSQKHRNGSNGGRHGSASCAVPTSVLPPLCWSSASLMCHLRSAHTGRRNCLDRPWTWSPARPAESTTILLDHNQRILFHPRTSSSTQAVLADRPLPSTGKHYWEIYMPAVYGTSIMFGIATNRQQLISSSFTNLIGLDQHGWGLSHQGVLWHNGTSRQYLPQPIEPLGALLIGLEFDGDARTLSYVVNNQPAGVAFRDLPRDVVFYPAVSSTSAQSTMILKHRCKICSSLREICVKLIRSSEWGEKIDGELLPCHLRQQLIE